MKKKFLLSFVLALISIFALGAVCVSAMQYEDLKYNISYGCVTITGCDTSVTEVTIPEEIDGCPVTSIGGNAFSGCSSLTSISIPNSVTSIGSSVFSGCSSLTSISIPNSVTSIGDYAFSGCSSLTNVTIPNSVTSIGKEAFLNDSNIANVYISDIESWCKIEFSNCYSNPLYYGGNLYHNQERVTRVVIPNGITNVKDYVFYGYKSLTDVIIPDGVTGIGNNAFSSCSSLTNVTIPNSVTSIGRRAFWHCSNLTSITIPNGVISIGKEAFYYCSSLTSIAISDGVTSIGDSTFSGCSSLTSIVIPDSVTRIGKYAFYGCSSLISIIIPDGVTSIEDSVFVGCDNLTSITMPDGVTNIGDSAFSNCNSLTSIIIPDSVTSIGRGAFSNCGSLASITMPDSVTSIGENAFQDCSSIANVHISDIESWCKIKFGNIYSNPLRYGRYLYYNQERVTKLVIPDSVTCIGDYAFSNCGSLTSITIPDSVTSIGNYAFYNCNSLTSVKIPDSVISIGYDAFLYCSSLTSITIPDSVTSIGNYAFSYCNSLKSITIPDSVTSIGDYAFYSCDSLVNLSVGSGVTTIPQKAFYSCQNLKYVCLPKELLYIRNDAFNDCPNIEKVFYAGSEDEWNNILKYNRNENLTTKEIIYNIAKRTYRFDTGCDASVSEITDYAVFVQPEAENGDKKLEGWYDNKNFNGSPVVFPYYGNAETLYAKWTDKTGLGFDDAFTAEANREYTVTTTDGGQTIYYEFVPKFTGEYRFFSKGNLDTYGYLYNSDRKLLVSDNNSGEGNNFKIAYNLTAGEKYYIAVNCLSGYGQFTLATETNCVESTKTVCVTATTGEKIFITIPKYLPQNARIILACYKGEKFVEMKSAPNTDETVYFIVNTDFDFAKVMVWDSIGTMIPVCHAEDVGKIS